VTRAASAACTVCEVHAESVFKVEGMDCHEEVAILERRLKHLGGLEAMSADVMGQRLVVKYDAARLTTSAIADAVADTGMRAWLEHEQPHVTGASAVRLRLLAVSGAALVIGFAIAWTGRAPGLAAAAWLVAIGTGGVFPARRAIAAARARALDINALMAVAVTGALVIGEWSEAATVVFLFALAQYLESRSMDRARHAIRALVDLAPPDALVLRPGGDRRIPLGAVAVGEVVRLRPGDKVPLDGVVVEGGSDVNQAPITGESLPVDKHPGDELFAGSINGHGALTFRVTHAVRDTMLARVIHLVEQAQAERAPSQALVDRFARYYTPAVIALAAAVAVLPPLAGAGGWLDWLYRALVLLVISCPCALVISTPVAIVSALAAAARRGVLIKGGAHLERTAALRCIAFDKTGTLTRGEPAVLDVDVLGGSDPALLLALAASVESHSAHPVARAVVAHAFASGIPTRPAADARDLPGRGCEARVDGRLVVAGNARLFAERGLLDRTLQARLDAIAARGRTAVIVAREATVLGILELADRPRQAGRAVMELLGEHGVAHVAMLTGDSAGAARAIASEVGISEVHAELLPGDKVAAIRRLRVAHGPVGMVGDGVNDAPALAAADVGFAMGAAGSGAALETADVALMGDDLAKIPYALRLSRAALFTIRTNIAISVVLKAVFLVLAVTGHATLWMAIVADTGASLLVVANGLRLLRTS
jgi:Cd2+/Zn2+-exporting ATPase